MNFEEFSRIIMDELKLLYLEYLTFLRIFRVNLIFFSYEE